MRRHQARRRTTFGRSPRSISTRTSAGLAALACLVGLTTLSACAPATTTAPTDLTLPAHDPRFAEMGASSWTATGGSLTSTTSCTVRFVTFEPEVRLSDVTVVWTHGFLRNLDSMRGWAEATASHGVRSVAVSTCASTPFDGRHDVNAADLRAVADAVAGPSGPVVYAGFSAGGLASLLAAADDSRATGLVGLDAVDSGNLAISAIDADLPALFLAGEPHACNADGNMVPVARSLPGATVVRIPFATHGDFERPTDPLVDRLCGGVEPDETRERIRVAIRSLAVAWILDVAKGESAR